MRQQQILTTAALGFALAGCASEQPAITDPALHQHAAVRAASPGIDEQLAALRRLTAPFHSFAAARDAGWGTQLTACFSSPEGGMGFHYANVSLIDGTVDAAAPELLMYEPQQDGSLRFVGVEYIVPRTAWSGSEPPVLYGQTYAYVPAFDIYGLHVWVGRHNPHGVFASWNPLVSCEHAGLIAP